MKSINPTTGEEIRHYTEHTDREVGTRINSAEPAFRDWHRTTFDRRAAMLTKAAEVLRYRREEYARGMTEEMGKPILESRAEIDKCAWVCDYYAEHAERFLREQRIETDATESLVRFDPLGPVLAIMPWNFPFWQVFRFAAPALMAGNVGLLKHAANVPASALALEQVFQDAGMPKGVFTTLLISSEKVEAAIAHPAIRAVSLTGSERAGAAVGAVAGQQIKKCVLELGGSDPFIVLSDADVAAAAQHAVKARCINSGQSCIAAKRFIVESVIFDEFQQAITAAMKQLSVGDPLDEATDIGPLARQDLVETLHDQVARSIDDGGHLVIGGGRPDRSGFFYEPTVVSDVTPSMAVFAEETFGPVAALVRADNAAQAVLLANQTTFGLGASIWSKDIERAKQLAIEIDAGNVFINGMVKSDPRLPFGGVKRSGYGRELSDFGIREFVNIKTVCVA